MQEHAWLVWLVCPTSHSGNVRSCISNGEFTGLSGRSWLAEHRPPLSGDGLCSSFEAASDRKSYRIVSAWSIKSTSSWALRLDEPVAGDADAGREATVIVRPGVSRLANSRQMKGQAPMFSGSSCAHTSSALGYCASTESSAAWGSG